VSVIETDTEEAKLLAKELPTNSSLKGSFLVDSFGDDGTATVAGALAVDKKLAISE
jgi:hypothetical protein